MMVRQGNPELRLRLDPEAMELLRQKAGEGSGGIAGGVALYVRRLIYEDLGMPMPPQWGRKGDLVPDFIRRLQKWVESLETGAAVANVERIQHEMDSTAAVLSGLDPPKPYTPEDERMLRSLLGRLYVLRFRMDGA